MNKDRLDPRSAKFLRRQVIWRHNSFFGHVAMARQNMRSILNSTTASDESKVYAVQIENLLELLGNSLKHRKPDHAHI